MCNFNIPNYRINGLFIVSLLGSIIRCLRRMEEMLRELIQASKSIGNTELQDKFYAASNAIKRDIVFAPSLYL